MTEEEIAEIMNMPFDDLFDSVKDREILRLMLGLALELGRGMGIREMHQDMNKAFRGYNETLIRN